MLRGYEFFHKISSPCFWFGLVLWPTPPWFWCWLSGWALLASIFSTHKYLRISKNHDLFPSRMTIQIPSDDNIAPAMAPAAPIPLTPWTCHIDIRYISLCEWVERNLFLLDWIDTSINMSDHLTKSLQPLLFHRYANFLLRHVPPSYSPIYSTIVGKYTNHTIDIEKNIPQSLTTPLTAAAVQVYAPLRDDYAYSPWLLTLGHGDTVQCSHDYITDPDMFNLKH